MLKDGVALNYQEDAAEFDGIAGHLKNGMAPFYPPQTRSYSNSGCRCARRRQSSHASTRVR